jgi:DNA polymerase III epsilon subunit-like protein
MPRYGCTVELLTEANGGRWPRSDKAMALALANADGREIDFNDSSKNTRHRAKFDAECCRTVVVGLVFGK